MAKLGKSAKELRGNLAAPLKASEPGAPEERTVFHRTIIVSVHKTGPFNPADRLEATDVSIALSNARFESWDTLATAYTTINAGTVQLAQTRGATENLSLGAPAGSPVTASGAFSASQSNTRTENFTASTQAETLSATIEDGGKKLVIHRQGGIGIDLTGNTVIKADIAYAAGVMHSFTFSIARYKDSKGKAIPPDKLSVRVTPLASVPPGTSIDATVGLVYTMRHVISGDDTYEEKDDRVREITAKAAPVTAELIPVREASPPGFGIFAQSGRFSGFAVAAQRTGRNPVDLCFKSYEEASDFLAYLKSAASRRPARVGAFTLGFVQPPGHAVTPLSPADLPGLIAEAKCL